MDNKTRWEKRRTAALGTARLGFGVAVAMKSGREGSVMLTLICAENEKRHGGLLRHPLLLLHYSDVFLPWSRSSYILDLARN